MDSKNMSTSSVTSSTSTFSKKQTKSVQMVSQSSTDSSGKTTTTASVSAKASKEASKSMEHSESIDGQTRKEVTESKTSSSAVMKSTQHHQHSLEGLNSEILALTGGTPDDFVFKPFFNMDRMLMDKQSQSFEDITNRQIARQDDIFEMKINVQDYEPEDIQVKVTDDLVTIQGKTEKRIDEHNFKTVQFSKKFTIPHGVTPETIACSLSKTKVLTISAPIKKQNLAQIQQSDSKESVSKLQHRDVTQTQKQQEIMNESSRKSSVSSDVSSIMDEVVYQPKSVQNVVNISTTQETFVEKIHIDAKKFKAEEIRVTVNKNLVRVEGNHKDEFSSRSFYKEFTLPYGVKPENLQCTFSPDGSLTISGPIDTPKSLTQHHQTTTQEIQQQKKVTEQHQQVRQEVTESHNKQQQQTQQRQVEKQQQITNERNTDIAKIQSVDSIFSDTTTGTLSRDSSISTVPPTPTDDGLLFRPMVSRVPEEQRLIDTTKIFKENVVVKGYKAEEITVKVTKSSIVRIEGKHVEQFSSKSFYKEFTLPYGVKPETIQCTFSPDNETLTIQAPIKTERTEVQQIESTQQQQLNVAKSQQVQKTEEQHITQQKTQVQKSRSVCTKNVVEGQEQLTYQPRVTHELQTIDTTKTFMERLEVKNYKMEEISVKVVKNVIRVEGNHKEQFSSRSFYKEYTLPNEINPETLDVILSEDGYLTITAPLNTSGTNTTQTQQLVEQRQQVAQEKNLNKQVDSAETHHEQHQQVSRTEQRKVVQSRTVQQSVQHSSDSVSCSDSLQNQIIQPIVDLNDKTNFNALTNFEDVSKQLCVVQDHQKFEMKLNVAEYKPEELQVKICNNMVTIQGKQEIKSQNSSSSRSFYKKFTIPPGVNPESITSSLSSSGVLTISTPDAKQ